MLRTCDYCGKEDKDVTNVGVGLAPVYICKDCLGENRDEWDTPITQRDDQEVGEDIVQSERR